MKIEKMAQQQQPSIVVSTSSPGKALVCGGYLVLEKPNIGLVLAVDSRFHATVGILHEHNDEPDTSPNDSTRQQLNVDVFSPQLSSRLRYAIVYSSDQGTIKIVSRDTEQRSNLFVEKTLTVTFTYIINAMNPLSFHNFLVSRQVAVLAIQLRADNDFYSQINSLRERQLELTPQNVALLPSFLPPPHPLQKTGLGSSAALVTSLVGCLLRFFHLVDLPKTAWGMTLELQQQEGQRIAHNLAQICHCWAQGKIGSGFDVSSAIYGSQVYSRFSPDLLAQLLSHDTNPDGRLLVDLVQNTKWDASVEPLILPMGLDLIMADVCGGSESPSMATKIMKWKKESSSDIWNTLADVNKQIHKILQTLVNKEHSLGENDAGAEWNLLKDLSAEQWQDIAAETILAQPLLELRLLFQKARLLLKTMGNLACVPVEPDSQTALANATMDIPGVIAAGVPGAGGEDALFVLYIKGTNGEDVVRDKIGLLWKNWPTMNDLGSSVLVCPLSVRSCSGWGLCETDLAW